MAPQIELNSVATYCVNLLSVDHTLGSLLCRLYGAHRLVNKIYLLATLNPPKKQGMLGR